MSRRKRYSAEFKREALRRANEEGVTDVLVVEELGINARQLRRWREAAKRDGEKTTRSGSLSCRVMAALFPPALISNLVTGTLGYPNTTTSVRNWNARST